MLGRPGSLTRPVLGFVVLLAGVVTLLAGITVAPASRRPAPAAIAPRAACAGTEPDRARAAATLADLRLVNYYPSDHAQTNLWERWDPTAIDQDLGRIAALNANAVRLVLFAETFGYPDPDPARLQQLADFIAWADWYGLRVQLTLFGFWARYQDWAGSLTWAEAVLAPYRDDSRIAFIDLQNELETTQPGSVEWAASLMPCVRDAVGGIPVTVSVSGAEGVAGLSRLHAAGVPVDFYDLHYYGKPEIAHATFREALAAIEWAPLFIGETGYSTNPTSRRAGSLYGPGWWEAYQDQYLRTVAAGAASAGLPTPAPWILNDLTPGAFPAASRSGAEPAEYAYGLFRVDGTAKPAAHGIAAIFGGGLIDISFNNGFEDGEDAGLPNNWLVWQPAAAEFARDTTVARTGSASARVSGSRGNSTGLPAFYLAPVQPILPGQSYSAGVWATGWQNDGTTRIGLAWFDSAGRFLRIDVSGVLPAATPDWTYLDVSATAPATAASVEIHLISAHNSGTTWFDDVSFEPVSH